jgi:hypothetical protein
MLNMRLQRAITEFAGPGAPGDIEIVQCSSAGATGAIILYVWAKPEPYPRLVIKTPRAPSTDHAVDREWNIVNQLRRDERLAALIPMAIARFRIDDADFYAYEGVPGRTMVAILRNRAFTPRSRLVRRFASQALDAAAVIHATHSRLASPHEVARDMLSDLAWLESWVPALPPELCSRTRAYADLIRTATLSLPWGRIHGDFSLSNLMIRSRHAGAGAQPIDWEHSEAERPQHLDIFRFISTCDLMASRGKARSAIFRRMTAADNPLLDTVFVPWLARLGVTEGADWRTPELLRALWWHYCVHAARREQERLATPADFHDSKFLRNLATLEGL